MNLCIQAVSSWPPTACNNLIPALTAADQLRLVNRLAGGPKNFDPVALLESVGMAHRATNRPGQLSGGERQRVGIARALVSGAKLLLVDEPTASLDRARSSEVVELLARQSHEHGVATVMVTHDHDVLGYCDRIAEMVDGRLGAPARHPHARIRANIGTGPLPPQDATRALCHRTPTRLSHRHCAGFSG